MTSIIQSTLSPKGKVVSPMDLWAAVSEGEQVHSFRFHRYRSVLQELLRDKKIEARKEGDTLKGFTWVGKRTRH